jgi:hypothetical protein
MNAIWTFSSHENRSNKSSLFSQRSIMQNLMIRRKGKPAIPDAPLKTVKNLISLVLLNKKVVYFQH